MQRLHALLLASVLAGLPGPAQGAETGYDPLAVADVAAAEPVDLDLIDKVRERTIPVRVRLPAGTGPAPVVLFSHGLGGSRATNTFLAAHWASRGYVVISLQHPGSDDAVWREAGVERARAALLQAANGEQLLARIADVRSVLDACERLVAEPGHALERRMTLARVGMSGHSFGAITTQAVGGQALPAIDARDRRVAAAIALSPGVPEGGDAATAFGGVAIPWLLMTGTEDTSPIRELGVAQRLAVFPALPPGGKYECVLDGAQHSSFGDSPRRGEAGRRHPRHHRAILALTTAFWDAWLREDAAARAWLDGDGARSVLAEADRWQRK